MIVFSDMQFDAAAGYGDRWETQYERIVRRFAESGVQVCGSPGQHLKSPSGISEATPTAFQLRQISLG